MAERDHSDKFPKVPPFIKAIDTQEMLEILGLTDQPQIPPLKSKLSQAEIEKRATRNMQTIQTNLVNGGMGKTLTDSRPFGDNDKGKIGR